MDLGNWHEQESDNGCRKNQGLWAVGYLFQLELLEKQGKGKKITIVKYKAKKSSTRRKQGHRQPYTRVKIEAIEA